MYRIKGSYVVGILMFLILAGCQNQVEHTAPAIRPQDSVAMMTSYGVNTLVSDSGVIEISHRNRTVGGEYQQESIFVDL